MGEHEQRREDVQERTLDELVVWALATDDKNDAEYWNAVYVLQDRGTREVFDAACALCQSDQPRERELGADILGQGQSFKGDAIPVLLHALEAENDPHVLSSLACALGHQHDPRTIGPVARLSNHVDHDVRWAVVFSLLLGHNDPLAIETLIALSEDSDSDVRDWATFGLGSQIDLDTPEIRETLARRLNDRDRDTRLEALVGLAKRKDDRVLKPLLAELSSDQDVAELALTAAEALADPALCQALLGLTGSARAAASAAIQACGCQVP